MTSWTDLECFKCTVWLEAGNRTQKSLRTVHKILCVLTYCQVNVVCAWLSLQNIS